MRGGLTGRGEGGKIIMIDFLKGGRALSYLPRRSSSQRGGVGGGTIFIFFARPSFWARMKPLKGSRWVGGDREGRESSQGQVGGRGGGRGGRLLLFICFFVGGACNCYYFGLIIKELDFGQWHCGRQAGGS